jgi:hypothetical protein
MAKFIETKLPQTNINLGVSGGSTGSGRSNDISHGFVLGVLTLITSALWKRVKWYWGRRAAKKAPKEPMTIRIAIGDVEATADLQQFNELLGEGTLAQCMPPISMTPPAVPRNC